MQCIVFYGPPVFDDVRMFHSDSFVEDVLWKREARGPRRGSSEPSCSESRADSPTMTLYFRFHSGVGEPRDTRSIQHSHRAHPYSFPLSPGSHEVLSACLNHSSLGICEGGPDVFQRCVCRCLRDEVHFSCSRQMIGCFVSGCSSW